MPPNDACIGELLAEINVERRSGNDVEVAVPENTIDLAGLKPGIGSTGDPVVQIVSPIRASLVSLIPEIMYPTWPALSIIAKEVGVARK